MVSLQQVESLLFQRGADKRIELDRSGAGMVCFMYYTHVQTLELSLLLIVCPKECKWGMGIRKRSFLNSSASTDSTSDRGTRSEYYANLHVREAQVWALTFWLDLLLDKPTHDNNLQWKMHIEMKWTHVLMMAYCRIWAPVMLGKIFLVSYPER